MVKKIIRNFLLENKVVANKISKIVSKITKRRNERNVVMFHPGRCGSTAIGTLLNQNPKVKWMGEAFKKSYEKHNWIREDPYNFIKFRRKICTSSVFGVEIVTEKLLKKLNREEPIKSFKNIGFGSFVLLKRLNLLSRLVSSLVAEKIGMWNTKKHLETPKVKIPHDKDQLIKQFEKYESFYKKIENNSASDETLILTYEEDVRESPKVAYRKICKFLGIEITNVETKTKKLNKGHISERIENAQEVENMLRNTKYEWMIHMS